MISPWSGIGLVLVILGALLATLGRMSHRHHPEAVRKTLHISMGLVTLSFPWLFARTWPVLLLACLSMLAFLALRVYPPLKLRLGPAIHGVSRASLGEMHFVLGTYTVFVLSAGNALMFCIPMLILTLADAAAALVGTWYGRHRFAAYHGQKTVEGSAAFFVVALWCTYLPLSLFTPGPGTEQLAAAVLVAAFATGLEATAGRGLDNLLIPVGAYLALKASSLSEILSAAGKYEPAATIALLSATALIALLGILLVSWLRVPGVRGNAEHVKCE